MMQYLLACVCTWLIVATSAHSLGSHRQHYIDQNATIGVMGPEDENPGARFAIGNTAMQKAADKFLPPIMNSFQDISIPSGSGKNYKYDTIKFEKIKYGSTDIGSDGSSLRVNIKGLGINIPKIRFSVFDTVARVKLSCSGKVGARVADTNILLGIQIKNQGGQPQTSISKSALNIGYLKLDYGFDNSVCKIGNAIIKLFIGDVDKLIRKKIEDMFPGMFSSALTPAINNALKSLSLAAPLGSNAQVLYDLVGPISMKSGISVGFRGMVNYKNNPIDFPFKPQRNDPRDLTRDVEIYLQDYVVNTASVVFRKSLSGSATWGNTSDLKDTIPVVGQLLYNKCQNCEFLIGFEAQAAPVFNMNANAGLRIDVKQVMLDVRMRGPGQVVPGLTLNIDFGASGRAFLTSDGKWLDILYGVDASFAFNKIDTMIGPVNGEQLSPFVTLIMNQVIIPYANQNFGRLPLPSFPGVVITDADNYYQTGILGIRGNLDFV